MTRQHPLRVGLFALGALVLLVAAVIAVGGGRLFAQTDSAELHFPGSVYGLQSGAPVVFRGVRVGSVTSVTVQDLGDGRYAVPVQVQIDRSQFLPRQAGAPAASLQTLVQRGLVARLAPQSLLTGLLYVDLDIVTSPPAQAAAATASAAAAGPTRIPTLAAPPGWQEQLAQLDLKQLGAELGSAASAARALLADPALRQSVAQLARLSESLARSSSLLEARLPALAGGLQSTLGQAGEASAALASAARQLGQAAEQVAGAAKSAQGLMAADSPLLASVNNAAGQLAQAAAALQRVAAEDSPAMQNLDGTLAEMRRATRAVRELAELLGRHPEALLRGNPEAR